MTIHASTRRRLRLTCVCLLALAVGLLSLVAVVFGLGLCARDAAALRSFAEAANRWQSNPDFRTVQREYVDKGVTAMRVRLLGVPARRVVMSFRAIPGLPPSLSVNPTSAAHYRAFSAGPLSAYLHLVGEQGLNDGET